MKIFKQPCQWSPVNVILYPNKTLNPVLCPLFIKLPCVAAECVNYGDVPFNFQLTTYKKAVSLKKRIYIIGVV